MTVAEKKVARHRLSVLPQYRRWGLEVKAVLTDNGREFCGTESHPYELYLSLGDIEHRTTRVRSPRTNGFVERFNRTVLDEFFRPAFRRRFYASVAALQKDLDKWLHHDNHERPHQGYRNMDARPIDTVMKFTKKRTRKLHVHHDRHRSLVDQVHVHHGAEEAALDG